MSLEVYDALAAWARADVASEDLLDLVDALMKPLQGIADIVRDEDDFVGWARLMDVDAAPEWALPWLAQFVGVVALRGLADAEQRARIKGAAGFNRGSPEAIRAAARQFLTGRKTMQVFERDGSPWRFRIRVYSAETPDPPALLAAVNALKPAGLVFVLEVQQGLSIDEVTGTINSYAQTIESFSNTIPGTAPDQSTNKAYGVGSYGRGNYGGVI